MHRRDGAVTENEDLASVLRQRSLPKEDGDSGYDDGHGDDL
jgi:hypothetical protein